MRARINTKQRKYFTEVEAINTAVTLGRYDPEWDYQVQQNDIGYFIAIYDEDGWFVGNWY